VTNKTIFHIIFDDASTDEASQGLEQWVDDYASLQAENDQLLKTVAAIFYNPYDVREVFLSSEYVNDINGYLEAAYDKAINEENNLRKDYYQDQL